MDPLIITVAAVGAEVTKEQQPNLPITPDELAADAAACRDAGASIYHLHVRDPDGMPTMDVETFRAARDAIASATDLIVQFTSGGSTSDTHEERWAPLELKPEMASLTTGTVNFGDYVFFNPPWMIKAFYKLMRERNILPEFEIFEPGMIANAESVSAEFGDNHHRHYDFVLGVPGAMPAWDDALGFLSSKLPPGATWSATGIGRAHLAVARAAIASGGHVRTGFEDVRFYEAGVVAESNSQLIRRVAGLASEQGRQIATPTVARELLGLG